MTNPNDPAFPFDANLSRMGQGVCPGLTKREYFAAMAMQGILANSHMSKQAEQNCLFPKDLAKFCVDDADALIAELNKDKKHGQ